MRIYYLGKDFSRYLLSLKKRTLKTNTDKSYKLTNQHTRKVRVSTRNRLRR